MANSTNLRCSAIKARWRLVADKTKNFSHIITITVVCDLERDAASGASFVSTVIEECTKLVTDLGHPPLPAFNAAAQIIGLFAQPSSTYGLSMLIDMEDGRPTEGEHTIGDLTERAAQASPPRFL